MQRKVIGKDIIWGLINVVVSVLITMIILPQISSKLGIEAYGFTTLSTDIIKYIDLIASTINFYAIRYISVSYHKRDLKKAEEYYSSVAASDIIMAVILIIPAIVFLCLFQRFINVSPDLLEDVRLLFFLTFVNYAVTIIGTVFTSAAFIKNIQYKGTRLLAISSIFKGAIMLLMYKFLVPHVWYYGFAILCSTFFVFVGNLQISFKYLHDIKIRLYAINFKSVLEIASKGIWNTINSIGTTLNSGLDLLVSNINLGAVQMGILSVDKLIGSLTIRILGVVTNSFRPQLLIYYSNNEAERLKDCFNWAMKCTGLMASLIFSLFLGLGHQFLCLWIPEQDCNLIYILGIITLLSETITGFTKPLSYATILAEKVKFTSLCGLAVGMLNVLSMLLLRWCRKGVDITEKIGYNCRKKRRG